VVLTNAGLLGLGSVAEPLRVAFAGTGTATTAARSDHQHSSLDTLAVVGAGSVGTDLSVGRDLDVGRDLTVEGLLLVGSDALIDGTLTVSGATTFLSRVTMPPGTRIGNTIIAAYSGNMPTTQSGYSSDPLHIQTAWRCNITDAVMYNLNFRGYNFNVGVPFDFTAVGYMYGPNGHTKNTIVATIPGSLAMTTYCATEGGGANGGYLTFRMVQTGGVQWHASDIVIDVVGGGSFYNENGADTFVVRRFVNQATNL
jgi:hypothetical protein